MKGNRLTVFVDCGALGWREVGHATAGRDGSAVLTLAGFGGVRLRVQAREAPRHAPAPDLDEELPPPELDPYAALE